MFYFGIISLILLWMYIIYKKDILKSSALYLSFIMVFYLLIYKVSLQAIIADSFIHIMVLSLSVILISLITYSSYQLLTNSDYFDSNILDLFYKRTESKAIILFFLGWLLLTNSIIVNLFLLIFIYSFFNVNKKVSFFSINQLLIISVISSENITNLFLNTLSTNQFYSLIHFQSVVLAIIFMISLTAVIALSFSEMRIEKKISFHFEYLLYLFIMLVLILFFKDKLMLDVIKLMLLMISFFILVYFEKAFIKPQSRYSTHPILLSLLLIIIFLLGFRVLFVNTYIYLITMTGLTVGLTLSGSPIRSVVDKKNIKVLIAIVIIIVSILIAKYFYFNSVINNINFGSSYSDFFITKISLVESSSLRILAILTNAGFIFGYPLVGNTQVFYYQYLLIITLSLFLIPVVQLLIVKLLKFEKLPIDMIVLNYLFITILSFVLTSIAIV